MIRFNGYYRSDLKEFPDFHAGNDLTEWNYIFLVFRSDGTALRIINNSVIHKDLTNEILKSSKAIYSTSNNRITVDLMPDLKTIKPFNYTMLSNDIIIDSQGDKYHFHPWREE